MNETYQTFSGVPTVLPILAADQAEDGLAIASNTVTLTTAPTNGAIINFNRGNGAVTYESNPGFYGTDTFTYVVFDVDGNISNPATITIHVYPQAPTANNLTVHTTENTPVVIPILGADTVPTGATLIPKTIDILIPTSNGTTSINYSNGNVTYTPNNGFIGTDVFTYQVEDSQSSESNVATITIKVSGKAPTANNDVAYTAKDTAVNINILANDTDPNPSNVGTLDPSSVAIVAQPANGTVAINPKTGIATYTPTTGFVGTDTFKYTVEDTTGATSNVATVTITVENPPTAGPISVTTNEEVPILINVLPYVTGNVAALNPASLIFNQPTNGTAVSNGAGGVLYTPNYNFYGTDVFQYQISDIHGIISTGGLITITVNFVDKPPVAVSTTAGTDEDTPVDINVLSSDYDPNPARANISIDPTTVQITSQPTNGTVAVDPVTGLVTYTPAAGFQGEDAFTYTVNDDYTTPATSNPATVIVRVGATVTLSGEVYVPQSGSNVPVGAGVTVNATFTSGPATFTVSTLTQADGTYTFAEGNAADASTGGFNNYVLPSGTYTISLVQPGYFVGGAAVPGTPAPSSYTSTQFNGITLSPGEAATGFDFTEKGLQADFISAYLSRRAFFASAEPTVQALNLTQGPAWFSFDNGTPNLIVAQANGSSGTGAVTMTLYNSSMQVVAAASGASGTANLQVPGSSGTPYFLEVTGTNTSLNIKVGALASAPVQYYNAADPMDVNGDGSVTPLDVLDIINALSKQGSGPLPLAAAKPGQQTLYLDVEDTGNLTPLDAVAVINYLNQQAVTAQTAALASATPQVAPAVETAVTSTDVATPAVTASITTTPAATTATSSTASSFQAASGSSSQASAAAVSTSVATDQALTQLTASSSTPSSAAVMAVAKTGSTVSTTTATSTPATTSVSSPVTTSTKSTTSSTSTEATDSAIKQLNEDDAFGRSAFLCLISSAEWERSTLRSLDVDGRSPYGHSGTCVVTARGASSSADLLGSSG